MISAKCIEKVRDKNDRIISYVLLDTQGNQTIMESNQLKNLMFNNEIDVVNLKMTSDGRLIDKDETEPQDNRRIRNATEKELIAFCDMMWLEAALHDIAITKINSDYITVDDKRIQLVHWHTDRFQVENNVVRALVVNKLGEENGYNLVGINPIKFSELKGLTVGVECNVSKENGCNSTLYDYTIHIRETDNGKPVVTERTKEMEENINKVLDSVEYNLYSKAGNLFGLSEDKMEECKRAVVAFATSLLIMRALGVNTAEHCRWGSKVRNDSKIEEGRKLWGMAHKLVESMLKQLSGKESLLPESLTEDSVDEISKDYYNRLNNQKMPEQMKTSDKLKKSKGIKGIFNAFSR